MSDGRNEKAREEMKKKMKPAIKEAAKSDIMKVLNDHKLSIAEAKEVVAMVDVQIMLAHTDNVLKQLIGNTFKQASMGAAPNDNSSEVPKMPQEPKAATENKADNAGK